MNDPTPRVPHRPLIWPDFVLDLQEILSELPQPVYIVGGAVRDALLHRPVKDLDLTVAQDGIGVARRIANAYQGDFYPLDKERDVGRALVQTREGRLTIDVARLRGADLMADLTDRDFTMNAMAVDLLADLDRLIDPLQGESDLREKVLRRCSPRALADDPLRGLRAVRQSVQFKLHIEVVTREDIRTQGEGLRHVSPERVRDEFMKILALSKVAGTLRVADALGLLPLIIPEIEFLKNAALPGSGIKNNWHYTLSVIENLGDILAALTPGRRDAPTSFSIGALVMQLDRYREHLSSHLQMAWPNERSHDGLLMLAALLHGVGAEQAHERGLGLRLSRAEVERLQRIVLSYRQPLDLEQLDDLAIHRFWYKNGPAGVDVCLLALANYLSKIRSAVRPETWLPALERVRLLLQAYYERHDEVVAPAPVVEGNQLMRTLNLSPGPLVGELLDYIREAQVTGEVHTLDDAIAAARAYIQR